MIANSNLSDRSFVFGFFVNFLNHYLWSSRMLRSKQSEIDDFSAMEELVPTFLTLGGGNLWLFSVVILLRVDILFLSKSILTLSEVIYFWMVLRALSKYSLLFPY